MSVQAWFQAMMAGGYDVDAQSLFSRGAFTTYEKAIINEAIIKLKADLQWNLIYTLKVYGVSSESNSILDWKNASYNATKVGSPTFTPYEGWTGINSTSHYIRSGFNPNGVVSLNSVTFMVWSLNSVDSTNIISGCQNGANEGLLIIPRSSGNRITRCNSSANDTTAAGGTGIGYFSLNRTGSTNYGLYSAHSLTATISKSSSGVPNFEMYDLCTNNAGSAANAGTRQIGGRVVASGSADLTKIGDAINDCMVRLNALGL